MHPSRTYFKLTSDVSGKDNRYSRLLNRRKMQAPSTIWPSPSPIRTPIAKGEGI
jgi:hypothetical protein